MAARRCPRTAPGTLAFEFLHSASEKGRGDLRSTDGPDSVRVADDTPGTAGASFAVDLFIGNVDCLAPGGNGFRAAFQWEMKCTRGRSPSRAKSAAVFEPQRGGLTKPG